MTSQLIRRQFATEDGMSRSLDVGARLGYTESGEFWESGSRGNRDSYYLGSDIEKVPTVLLHNLTQEDIAVFTSQDELGDKQCIACGTVQLHNSKDESDREQCMQPYDATYNTSAH